MDLNNLDFTLLYIVLIVLVMLFPFYILLLKYLQEIKEWNEGISPAGLPWIFVRRDHRGHMMYSDGCGNTCWLTFSHVPLKRTSNIPRTGISITPLNQIFNINGVLYRSIPAKKGCHGCAGMVNYQTCIKFPECSDESHNILCIFVREPTIQELLEGGEEKAHIPEHSTT
jgi:hypothetical protein